MTFQPEGLCQLLTRVGMQVSVCEQVQTCEACCGTPLLRKMATREKRISDRAQT